MYMCSVMVWLQSSYMFLPTIQVLCTIYFQYYRYNYWSPLTINLPMLLLSHTTLPPLPLHLCCLLLPHPQSLALL